MIECLSKIGLFPQFSRLYQKLGSVPQFSRLYQNLHQFPNFQGFIKNCIISPIFKVIPLKTHYSNNLTSPNWFQKYGWSPSFAPTTNPFSGWNITWGSPIWPVSSSRLSPWLFHQYLDPAIGTICGFVCFRRCFSGTNLQPWDTVDGLR